MIEPYAIEKLEEQRRQREEERRVPLYIQPPEPPGLGDKEDEDSGEWVVEVDFVV